MTPAERAEIEALAQQAVAELHDVEVARLTVTTMTPLEEPETGWCPACNLPSVLSWLLAFEANGRLFDDRLTRLSVCTDCGAETWS